jgi:putative resolvase
LREWALEQGVHPKTAYRWFREGTLPVPARGAGRLILVSPDPKLAVVGRVVAYCRVVSAGQKDDLERQAGRVVAGATGRGLAVGQVVSEVGSGMKRTPSQAHEAAVGPCRYGHCRGAS